MTQQKDYKIKVLALCDSPTVSTGFATVTKNVFKHLVNTGKYEITIVGINHYGEWYDQTNYPYKIYPAMPHGYTDYYGRGKMTQILSGIDQYIKNDFDLVFILQDHFIIAGSDEMAKGFNLAESIKKIQRTILENDKIPNDKYFGFIFYSPVDGNLRPYWVDNSIRLADFPVSYTEYGKNEMIKVSANKEDVVNRVKIVPHGCNAKDFYPISEEEKKKFRSEFFDGVIDDDTFLIINVSRNQIRKDMVRTLMAYRKYKEINPKAFLYLHCKQYDQGGDIWELASQLGLEEGRDLALPRGFDTMHGMPIDVLNKIYNSADVSMTTTHGEGWGFILTESMATKTPILAPMNTSIPEIFNADDDNLDNYEKWRGIPCKLLENGYVNYGAVDNGVVRPIVDVDDVVSKLDWVYKNKDKVEKIVDNGFEYVTNLTWDNVGVMWDKIFTEAYESTLKARETGKMIYDQMGEYKKDIGRNDPCWCGSGKKIQAVPHETIMFTYTAQMI